MLMILRLENKLKVYKRESKNKNKKLFIIGVKSSFKDLYRQIKCTEEKTLIKLRNMYKLKQNNK